MKSSIRVPAKVPFIFTNGTSAPHRSDLFCVDITSKTGFCRMSIHLALLALCLFLITGCCCMNSCPVPSTIQDARKLFVVHIHGDWCKTCGSIDSIIHETEDYWTKRDNVEYLVFDETNPAKIKASAAIAMKLNLADHFENERHTGELLFIDQDTKKILTKFYGVASQEQYIEATEELLKGNEVASILAKRRNYQLSKPTKKEIQKAKLLVIDIHHDMCGGCSITAPVFEEVAKDYIKDKRVCFMTFDLSDRTTTKATRELAQELEIEEIYNNQKHTGEVLFVKRKNNEILDKLILERDIQVYHDLIKKLKKQV